MVWPFRANFVCCTCTICVMYVKPACEGLCVEYVLCRPLVITFHQKPVILKTLFHFVHHHHRGCPHGCNRPGCFDFLHLNLTLLSFSTISLLTKFKFQPIFLVCFIFAKSKVLSKTPVKTTIQCNTPLLYCGAALCQ